MPAGPPAIPPLPADLAVATLVPHLAPACARLAAELGVPCTEPGNSHYPLQLTFTPERLELREVAPGAPGAIFADLSAARAQHRRGRLALLRAAAAGNRKLRIIDATAGLGADALLLAAHGHEVVLLERSPVIAALLADALARASGPHVQRLRLAPGDARELLLRLAPADVVILDPMYPRSGKRARKNKAMHLFRTLVGDDADAGELLHLARRAACHRVVVKRPRRAPPLAGETPTGSITGRTTRFDIYPPSAGDPIPQHDRIH